MITPRFSITQDDSNLYFEIQAAYANLRGLEVEYTGNLFLFSCSPYFLRVHLPSEVSESEGGNTCYDCDKVQKKEKGQFFENLDMITELLRPQNLPSANNLVEEVNSENNEEEEEDAEEYYQEQKPIDLKEYILDEQAKNYGYGFGWKRMGILELLREKIGNLVDLRHPELVPIFERVNACKEYDCEKFDSDRYLVDNLKTEEELLEIIKCKFEAELEITDVDRDKLKDLPNKKLPEHIPKSDKEATLYSLVDLVFAWAYDQRVNGWERNCESGWTISHISPTLSYLVKWNTVKEACIGVVRRSLCYPLYRNWNLSMKVLEDISNIFEAGKTALLHILCDIHASMITSSEFRYLFNDLLITDLILWVQTLSQDSISNIGKELLELKIEKDDVDLDLCNIELNGQVLLMAINNKDSDDEDEEVAIS